MTTKKTTTVEPVEAFTYPDTCSCGCGETIIGGVDAALHHGSCVYINGAPYLSAAHWERTVTKR